MGSNVVTKRNPIVQWLIDHGYKALIWIQFIVALLIWITADPDPEALLATLEQCISQ